MPLPFCDGPCDTSSKSSSSSTPSMSNSVCHTPYQSPTQIATKNYYIPVGAGTPHAAKRLEHVDEPEVRHHPGLISHLVSLSSCEPEDSVTHIEVGYGYPCPRPYLQVTHGGTRPSRNTWDNCTSNNARDIISRASFPAHGNIHTHSDYG